MLIHGPRRMGEGPNSRPRRFLLVFWGGWGGFADFRYLGRSAVSHGKTQRPPLAGEPPPRGCAPAQPKAALMRSPTQRSCTAPCCAQAGPHAAPLRSPMPAAPLPPYSASPTACGEATHRACSPGTNILLVRASAGETPKACGEAPPPPPHARPLAHRRRSPTQRSCTPPLCARAQHHCAPVRGPMLRPCAPPRCAPAQPRAALMRSPILRSC